MPDERVGYWKVYGSGRRAKIMRQDAVADELTEKITEYFFPEGVTYKRVSQLNFLPNFPSVTPSLTDAFRERGLIGRNDSIAIYCPRERGLLFAIGIGGYKGVLDSDGKLDEEAFSKGWFIWGVCCDFPFLNNYGVIKILEKENLSFSRDFSNGFKYGDFKKVI